MELVFKVPKGKPPFMGVLYGSEFEAARTNQELVNDYKNCEFDATLEPVNARTFNLVLRCRSPLLKYEYKNLEFKYESFLRWKNYATGSEVNFSHIIIRLNEHKVVKTTRQNRLFVLKLQSVELIGEKIV